MNPPSQFCHTPQGPARGPRGQGNSRVPSDADQRYRCTPCGQTCAATTGTPCYRVRTAADVVTVVLTLVCHGCALQAMVAAFGLDERTVAAWVARAGQHCQQGPQPVVQQGRVDLPPVQADELWVKRVGRRVWMAMAVAVPSRLWLGGVISPHRHQVLITTRAPLVRSCAHSLARLVGVDGLASYVTACLRVFRPPRRTGRRGRPRLRLAKELLLGQGVTRYVQRRVVSVERRVVRGTEAAIAAVLATSGGGSGINTAYSARLNATFRASLAPLARRGRAIAPTEAVLTAGMWRVGWAYHVCWLPQRLRLAAPAGAPWQWQEWTPAMAASLPDHRWTMRQRFRDQVPLPPWVAPKRRGRPPKRVEPPTRALAT